MIKSLETYPCVELVAVSRFSRWKNCSAVTGRLSCHSLPSQVSRKYGLSRAPKLVEMIAAVPEEHRAMLLPQLRAKPVRTASGIAVVAVMSKPHRCPHIATTGEQHQLRRSSIADS